MPRLIDADALIEQNKELADREIEHPKYQMTLREVVDWMPTIEERKKGKRKETDDGWDGTYYVCSECGCPWTLIDGTPEDNGMNYCPNCGADMRGEKENNGYS